ncbi:MAG: GatB/YqeY domain-containing protein [Erysipelotrichaceae bacterium]
MKLLEQIKSDYFTAMKNKDSLKKGTLSLLVSAANLQAKEKGVELSDEEVITLIQKELKQARETLSLTPSDRDDLIDQANLKIELLNHYLPKQLSEEEIQGLIEKFAAEQGLEFIKKNQGLFMKGVMQLAKGQTDGKTLNQVLSSMLK